MPPAVPRPPPLFPIDDSEDGASLLRLRSSSKELEPQYTAFVQSYRLAHKWKSPLMKFKGLAKPPKDYKCPRLDAEFLNRFNREITATTSQTTRKLVTPTQETALTTRTSTATATPSSSKSISTTVTTTTTTPSTSTVTRTTSKPVKTTAFSSTSPPFQLNYTNGSLSVNSERANTNSFFTTESFDFHNQSDLVSSASSIANINSTFLVFNFLLVPVAIILVTLFLFMLAIIPIR